MSHLKILQHVLAAKISSHQGVGRILKIRVSITKIIEQCLGKNETTSRKSIKNQVIMSIPTAAIYKNKNTREYFPTTLKLKGSKFFFSV